MCSRHNRLRTRSGSGFSSELVAVALLLALALCSLDADLLVVLLESCQILACLREPSLLLALADIPVHKCTLRVHQVELVVDTREDLGDGSRVALHTDGTHHLGKVTTWDNRVWLVVAH